MLDVTLTIGGVDFSNWLSTYTVTREISYNKVITTLDGIEHPYPGTVRPVIDFSFLPLSDEKAAEYYNVLSQLIVPVAYTDPYTGEQGGTMRVTSNLEAAFGLRSVDGNRYYKGGTVQLRRL